MKCIKNLFRNKQNQSCLDYNFDIFDEIKWYENCVIYPIVKHKVEILPGKEIIVKQIDLHKIPKKLKKGYWAIATDIYSPVNKIGYINITKIEYDWLINNEKLNKHHD